MKPTVHGAQRVVWLVVAVLTQYAWGLYPVLCRYFQTRAAHLLTGLQVSFLVNIIAAPGLLLFYTVPVRLRRWALARQVRQKNPCIAYPTASAAAAVAAGTVAKSTAKYTPPAGPHVLMAGWQGMPQSDGSHAPRLWAEEGIAPVSGLPRLAPLRVRVQQPLAPGVHSAPTTPFTASLASPTRAVSFPGSPGGLPAARPLSLLEDVVAVLSPRAPAGGAPPTATLQSALPFGGRGGAEPDLERGPGWGLEPTSPLLASPGAGAGVSRASLGRRSLLRRPSLIEDTATSRPELQDMVRVRLEVTTPRAPPFPPIAPEEPLSAHHGGSLGTSAPATPVLTSGRLVSPRVGLDLEETLLTHWGAVPLGHMVRRSAEPATPLPSQQTGAGFVSGAAPAVEGEARAKLKIDFGEEHHLLTPFIMVSISATALALLALALIFSVRFTEAHWCQLIFMLGPIFVGFLAKWLFGMPLPPRLWPALTLMLLGSALVILGKAWPNMGSDVLTWRNAVGLLLALVSALALAAYMILVQRTKDLISEEQILWANYLVQVVLPLGLSLGLEPQKLRVLTELRHDEWLGLVVVGLVLNVGANLTQQLTIRRLTAPVVATFLAMRVVGAISLSWPLLGEKVENGWEWAGVALVLLTVTWYMVVQKTVAAKEEIDNL